MLKPVLVTLITVEIEHHSGVLRMTLKFCFLGQFWYSSVHISVIWMWSDIFKGDNSCFLPPGKVKCWHFLRCWLSEIFWTKENKLPPVKLYMIKNTGILTLLVLQTNDDALPVNRTQKLFKATFGHHVRWSLKHFFFKNPPSPLSLSLSLLPLFFFLSILTGAFVVCILFGWLPDHVDLLAFQAEGSF